MGSMRGGALRRPCESFGRPALALARIEGGHGEARLALRRLSPWARPMSMRFSAAG